ncbi:MAG: DNA topoisomerase IB [Actinomycetota bacterium]|nr:DNA topoisomerase IB [Actinomycetota bacterium]
MAAICDPVEAAAEAGLRYVSDARPGITRRKRGGGFGYTKPDGSAVTDRRERERIAAIAIPPAWTDVWICPRPDGHILATGRDARGRKQYRYHPRWREVRDGDKFDNLAAFGRSLPELRKVVDADLKRPGMPREKVLGLVVKLLDETLIRVGNEAYASENESFGLTTLKRRHVEVDGPLVVFDFVGKSGMEHEVFLEDARLAKIVHRCHELAGQDLFTYQTAGALVDVTSSDVNIYLREVAGSAVTAKDFRTWGGTAVAAAALALSRPPGSAAQAEKAVLGAYDVAAQVLGNTRAVCRSCYVHPSIPEAYRSGALHNAWRRSRDTPTMDRKERAVLRLLSDS